MSLLLKSGKRLLMNNKLKIIHVISSPCGGGAEVLVRELTQQTNNLGIDCKAIYFNNWADCAKTIKLSNNEKSLNLNYRNPIAIIALRKLFKSELKEYSNLIVHAHLTWPMFFVPLACIGLSMKLVFTEHDTSNNRRDFPIFKYIEKIFYNQYNFIITITDGVRNNLLDWIGSDFSNKVLTIINGSRFFPYKERNSLKKCIKFISVGSLIKKKGFERTIKALSQLKNKNWQYEIVGNGPYKSELEKLINSLDLKEKVILSGWSSNLERKYHNADIMLIPSIYEGFGLVAIEGMSTGLPIVASDIVGLNEIVSSSVSSCFLVKVSENIFEWVNKIELCISILEKDPLFISKVSYQHSQKFSLDKMTRKYVNLYKQVLKND